MSRSVKNKILLLAVDLGLHSGIAGFDQEGHLLWARSKRVSDRRALKRFAHQIITQYNPTYVALEGDRLLAELWSAPASRIAAQVRLVPPEHWRKDMLRAKEMGSTHRMKNAAINRSPKGRALNHNAAEAMLLGQWALKYWVFAPPQ